MSTNLAEEAVNAGYQLREQKVAPSTHRVYVAALAFLYRVTLERPRHRLRTFAPYAPLSEPIEHLIRHLSFDGG